MFVDEQMDLQEILILVSLVIPTDVLLPLLRIMMGLLKEGIFVRSQKRQHIKNPEFGLIL